MKNDDHKLKVHNIQNNNKARKRKDRKLNKESSKQTFINFLEIEN